MHMYSQSSPTASDAGSITPSPVLSFHPVTQPSNNIPDQNLYLTSLELLNPNLDNRKLSNATSVTETDWDLRHLSRARSSFTHVDCPNGEKIFLDAGSEHEGQDEKKGESDKDKGPTQTNYQLELAQDASHETIGPKPFQFN